MKQDEVQEQMLKSPVGQAVNTALEVVRAIKDDVDHPEGIILLATVKIPGEDERMAGGVCIIGCKHGIENALFNAALEHPSFGTSIRKVAKMLKKTEKGEDDTLPKLRNMFERIGKRSSLDLSTMMMEKSAERLLESIKSKDLKEQMWHVEMIKKEMVHPLYRPIKGETMVQYLERITNGDMPPNLRALSEFVDNFKPAEASAN